MNLFVAQIWNESVRERIHISEDVRPPGSGGGGPAGRVRDRERARGAAKPLPLRPLPGPRLRVGRARASRPGKRRHGGAPAFLQRTHEESLEGSRGQNPPEFRRLEPWEVEDVLCIYKDELVMRVRDAA